jgi:hypothetical protein
VEAPPLPGSASVFTWGKRAGGAAPAANDKYSRQPA